MDLARYVVDAVMLEGRSYRDVARAHGVSKSWVAKLVGRFRQGGYGAIEPRSRAPRRIPHRTSDEPRWYVALPLEDVDGVLVFGTLSTPDSATLETVWAANAWAEQYSILGLGSATRGEDVAGTGHAADCVGVGTGIGD